MGLVQYIEDKQVFDHLAIQNRHDYEFPQCPLHYQWKILPLKSCERGCLRGRAGKKSILSSSFIGSPRHMFQLYQDAMSIVRGYGKPDLIITFTCNPLWSGITNSLLLGQKANDRPDLTDRVFRLKFRDLLSEILKNILFGNLLHTCIQLNFKSVVYPMFTFC